MNKDDLQALLNSGKSRGYTQAKAAHVARIKSGAGPGTTTASRLAWLEHQMSLVMLASPVAAILEDLEKSAHAAIRQERLDAIVAMPAAERSAALLALNESDIKNIATRFDTDLCRDLTPEARDRIFENSTRAAEIVFDLLEITPEREYCRVTQLSPSAPPSVAIILASAAPEPTSTCFVESVPPAISRASALSAWRRAARERETARASLRAGEELEAWPLPSLPA